MIAHGLMMIETIKFHHHNNRLSSDFRLEQRELHKSYEKRRIEQFSGAIKTAVH